MTVWKNNKIVTLISTCVGAEPVNYIERFDEKNKEMISKTSPQIVKDYNSHMGGVDLMDSFIGRYRIKVKSRKWYIRIVYHLLNMVVINSWFLDKKTRPSKVFLYMNFVVSWQKHYAILGKLEIIIVEDEEMKIASRT